MLADLHAGWTGIAPARWPWLRTPDVASELVGALFDQTWPGVAGRPECTPAVRALGDRLFGHIPAVERTAARAGPTTLVHGDASLPNVRSSSTGEIALLDWEDVGAAPGVADLAWLLVSSIDPTHWDETVAAYGSAAGLADALPAAASQGDLVPRGHTPWLRPGEQLGSAARGSRPSDALRPNAGVPERHSRQHRSTALRRQKRAYAGDQHLFADHTAVVRRRGLRRADAARCPNCPRRSRSPRACVARAQECGRAQARAAGRLLQTPLLSGTESRWSFGLRDAALAVRKGASSGTAKIDTNSGCLPGKSPKRQDCCHTVATGARAGGSCSGRFGTALGSALGVSCREAWGAGNAVARGIGGGATGGVLLLCVGPALEQLAAAEVCGELRRGVGVTGCRGVAGPRWSGGSVAGVVGPGRVPGRR